VRLFSICIERGRLAESSAQQILRLPNPEEEETLPASPVEARTMLGLKGKAQARLAQAKV
jgi:hypothetical protein